MSLPRYGRILRQQWMLIVAAVLIALMAAAAVTLLAPRTYRASAQLFIAATSGALSANPFAGSQFAKEQVKSYAEIANSPTVTAPVIEELGLPVTSEELGRRITAEAVIDTAVLDISVDDSAPDRAAQIANAVADRVAALAAELERPEGATSAPVKVTVVKPASAPSSPVSPTPVTNMLLALVLGLGAGIGLALLRDSVTRGLDTPEDVDDLLGLSTIGSIPVDRRSGDGPLLRPDAGSPVAEAFRQMRSLLKYVELSRGTKSLVVTSPLNDEGKTFTACNLAVALAESGIQVVLLEANLRRPRLAEYLHLDEGSGLVDVLRGRADVNEVMRQWGDTGNLCVVPAGPVLPDPSGLLESPLMQQLIRSLQNRYDLVLIDAPAVLPVAESAALCRMAMGTLLVVSARRSRRSDAAQALGNLRSMEARVLGVVLTMVPAGSLTGPYTSSAGYGKKVGIDHRGSRKPGVVGAEGRHSADSGDEVAPSTYGDTSADRVGRKTLGPMASHHSDDPAREPARTEVSNTSDVST